MRYVIKLARQTSIIDKTGGPFAAVGVRDGEIVGDFDDSRIDE